MRTVCFSLVFLLLMAEPLAVEPRPPEPIKQVVVEPSRAYSDTFICTGYCSCFRCTGKREGHRGYGITASGVKVSDVTVASSLPIGTVLDIQDVGIKIVQDRGVSGKKLDIWFPTHSEALKFGVKQKEVTFMRPEDLALHRSSKEYTIEELQLLAKQSGIKEDYPDYFIVEINGKEYIVGCYENDPDRLECMPLRGEND